MCPEACVYYFGLSWWAVWFQFIILVASIPVGVRTQPQCNRSFGLAGMLSTHERGIVIVTSCLLEDILSKHMASSTVLAAGAAATWRLRNPLVPP